jgi:dihydroorotate dehydrogenase
MASVQQWWPHNGPIYDITKSYADNSAEGPFFPGEYPARSWAPKEKWIDFLGHKIASPLGVPAGPLLNSKWTTLAARLGFDVVTYKTIRSAPHPGHSLPNVVYINTAGDLTRERWNDTLNMVAQAPSDINDIAITNSFGMPSREAEFLYTDIRKAKDELAEGQLLIVSVVGSACDKKDFVDDYIRAAKIGTDAGAPVIEANFSCPNVVTGEGKIYSNPVAVEEIASNLVKSLGDVPLLIKVGVFDDKEQMREMFKAAARAGVKGISGINTLSMKVIDATGQPALGPTRIHSGICGGPIRAAAIDWVRTARDIIDKERLPLALVGCGGIMKAEQFDDFLAAGADVAMSATGMMWDPLLALRYHNVHKA